MFVELLCCTTGLSSRCGRVLITVGLKNFSRVLNSEGGSRMNCVRERDELRARVERSRQAELEELERNDARRGLEQRRLEQSLVVRDHASERKRMQRDLQRVRGDISSAQSTVKREQIIT